MTNKEIFDLAERHGWLDDFGRWNFKDDGLMEFVLAVESLTLETKDLTSTVRGEK